MAVGEKLLYPTRKSSCPTHKIKSYPTINVWAARNAKSLLICGPGSHGARVVGGWCGIKPNIKTKRKKKKKKNKKKKKKKPFLPIPRGITP